ncbi:hypothetical protein A966_00735 [Brachyspira hampsonii 30446]|uniref:Uncharacterized protein n=1 Tax=Brachyspira hampsonii 30446 TaxID=1289135 RepID=A0A2U4EY19_9SPIR|nr:hypothetical protein A966_00735 [Brachyspira hampsonii 30446]MBW5390666.1 tetratricopeptide repeat protein [Brachyspira hampsonii]MBW5394069.1 tetratricopeptide repeat protein [Brachyspira hampsonii]OEJ17685.1 hypothetical protein A9495_07010 [Brachyspira hampsonii]
MKQYEEAIKDYNRVIELDNNNLLAYFNRGNTKLKLKQYEWAIEDACKCIEIDKNYIDAYNQIGKYRKIY